MSDEHDLDDYLARLSAADRAAKDGQPATLENIAVEPWNAVNRPLPADASPELRAAALTATRECVEMAYDAMGAARDPEVKFDAPAQQLAEDGVAPDAHEYFEQDWLNAVNRHEMLEGWTEKAEELAAPIRAMLEDTFNDRNAAELNQIAVEAAVRNIKFREGGNEIDVDALNVPEYSEAMHEALGRSIPEDASLYLVHRVHAAARDLVAATLDRDADPFGKSDLRELADLKARELEARERLADMTRDRDTPDGGPPPDRTQAEIDDQHSVAERIEVMEAAQERANDPTLQYEPLTLEARPYDGPPAAAVFDKAAHETARTPADAMNRDLADVTRQLAITAGVLGTPEHTAFQQAQAVRGDEITRTEDPERRAELRTERDAVAHIYAAGLADRIGNVLDHSGQGPAADEVKKLADTHRQIAEKLRSGEGGQSPPEGPDRPGGGSGQDRATVAGDATKREFAEAAKDAGREVLGKTAEVVMTAKGPDQTGPSEDQKERQQPQLAQLRGLAIAPDKGLYEIIQNKPHNAQPGAYGDEPARPGGLPRAPIGKVDEFSGERGRDDSSKRQAREDGELRDSPSIGERQWSAKEALAEVRREAAKEREGEGNDGPERPSGLSRAPIGKVDEASAEQGRDDSSKRQAREDGELRDSPSVGERQWSAKEALAEVRREAAKEREGEGNDGPERASGQGVARAAGRYASLGR
jgi:hypothetical protein